MFSKVTPVDNVFDMTDEHWEQIAKLPSAEWPEWFKDAALATISGSNVRAALMNTLPAMRKEFLIAKMKQFARLISEL